jgi:hypothetical protein
MNRESRQILFRTAAASALLLCGVAASLTAGAASRTFSSCTDYHCDAVREVTLRDWQWQRVRALFAGNASARMERQSIRRAIALLEDMVGAMTGTWRDLAGNVAGAGRAGQLDCISESRNTTTYLRLLSDDGLLEWHDVEERRVRHTMIFNTHWSAVIRERGSGERYAVDSWYLDNGQPPEIQPLEAWLEGRRMESE